MHKSKAVCIHGRPWYVQCLDCLSVDLFSEEHTTRLVEADFAFAIQVSNRDHFFRTHPEAARESTR